MSHTLYTVRKLGRASGKTNGRRVLHSPRQLVARGLEAPSTQTMRNRRHTHTRENNRTSTGGAWMARNIRTEQKRCEPVQVVA